jgi:hypothetical protein
MHHWKFSSRHLLAFTLFAAIAFASLRVGGPLAACTIGAVALFTTALGIVALVDCGERRPFAIGFLVPLTAYVAVHAYAGGNQLNPFESSSLITTRSFAPLYMAIRTVTWTETATGNVLPEYDPSTNRHISFGFGQPAVQFSQAPDQETFTLVAHSVVVVILGLIGANFAMYIYRTRDGG